MIKNRIKNYRHSIHDRIMKKLYKARGQIFTATDFTTYGLRNSIDKALSQLFERGEINRLGWGLYYLPKESKRFGSIPPDPEDIALAIARKQKSEILISGAQAANRLGLSTQIPSQYIFYTNGWPLKIRFDNLVIIFKHKSIKKMAGAGRVSGQIFQALRYLGKDNIMEATMNAICLRLSSKDIETIQKDASLAPLWMRPILKEIITKNERIYQSS